MIKLKIINAFSKDHPKIIERLNMLLVISRFTSTLAIVGIVLYESKKIENRDMAILALITCCIYGIACRFSENLMIVQAISYGVMCALGHILEGNKKCF